MSTGIDVLSFHRYLQFNIAYLLRYTITKDAEEIHDWFVQE